MIKDFTVSLPVPDEMYPIQETYYRRYYLCSIVGTSVRFHYSSPDYSDVTEHLKLLSELRPNMVFHIYKLNVNLQKIT